MTLGKRYRLLHRPLAPPNSQSAHDQCWRSVTDEWAQSAEEAVEFSAGKSSTPTDGTWLALCVVDGTFGEFTVTRRTQLVVAPVAAEVAS